MKVVNRDSALEQSQERVLCYVVGIVRLHVQSSSDLMSEASGMLELSVGSKGRRDGRSSVERSFMLNTAE